MELSKELIDFKNWCKSNTTRNLNEVIELAINNYAKSINCGSSETQAVKQNEQTEMIYCYRKKYNYDAEPRKCACDYCNPNRYKQ